jgi:hypothetical protein
VGLVQDGILAWVYADVGTGRFFGGAIEAYAPPVRRTGLLPAETVDAWLNYQRRATADGVFFAACTYYAYILRHVAQTRPESRDRAVPTGLWSPLRMRGRSMRHGMATSLSQAWGGRGLTGGRPGVMATRTTQLRAQRGQ